MDIDEDIYYNVVDDNDDDENDDVDDDDPSNTDPILVVKWMLQGKVSENLDGLYSFQLSIGVRGYNSLWVVCFTHFIIINGQK